MNFDYYYGDESNQFAFYRIPRQLITGEAFKKLSTDAKLLYGLLLDRMGLSAKNGWYDDMGRVFIYYTLDEIQEDLNCGHEKAVRLLAELDTGKKGFGLIERVKQGQGRPTKIYVKRFTTRTIPPQPPAPQDIPRLPIFGSQDFGKAEVKSSEKQKSRLPVIGSADFRKSDTCAAGQPLPGTEELPGPRPGTGGRSAKKSRPPRSARTLLTTAREWLDSQADEEYGYEDDGDY